MEEEVERKFEIRKEEPPPLERIFSEIAADANPDRSFEAWERECGIGLGTSPKRKEAFKNTARILDKREGHSTARPLNYKDNELLKTLFGNDVAISLKENEDLKQCRKSPEEQQEALYTSKMRRSQAEFMSKMQEFINKKRNFVQEKISQERKSHTPLLTFKGYMAQPKTVEELAFGGSQRKSLRIEKMKEEKILKEQSQMKPKPTINNSIKAASKLGLQMSRSEYIKELEKKAILRKNDAEKARKLRIEEDLKECSHKPKLSHFDNNILKKNLVDTGLNQDKGRSYLSLKKMRKGKENIPENLKPADFLLLDPQINPENTEKMAPIDKELQRIKAEIRSLLKD